MVVKRGLVSWLFCFVGFFFYVVVHLFLFFFLTKKQKDPTCTLFLSTVRVAAHFILNA